MSKYLIMTYSGKKYMPEEPHKQYNELGYSKKCYMFTGGMRDLGSWGDVFSVKSCLIRGDVERPPSALDPAFS